MASCSCRWSDHRSGGQTCNRFRTTASATRSSTGLLVTPPPDTEHADIAEALRTVLRVAAPAGVAVYTSALGVDLGASVPIPDLVAFHRRSGRRRAVDPTDILLVAEVVVPVGSGSTTSASGGRTPRRASPTTGSSIATPFASPLCASATWTTPKLVKQARRSC